MWSAFLCDMQKLWNMLVPSVSLYFVCVVGSYVYVGECYVAVNVSVSVKIGV